MHVRGLALAGAEDVPALVELEVAVPHLEPVGWWARAVSFVYPFRRTGRHGGGARSEFEARTDGVRDERLAKASTHSVLGPPSGAVGRDHDAGT